MTTMTSRWIVTSFFFALAPLAGAQVWVVDAAGGAGSDFTEIQPAIDASGPGATILVHPGTYSGFDLGVGLAILGLAANQTDTIVTGPVTIASVSGTHRVALSGLLLTHTLRVENASSAVLLDNLSCKPAYQTGDDPALRIIDSADVRMLISEVNFGVGAWVGRTGAHVSDSRLELIRSTVQGQWGNGTDCGGTGGGDGGVALLSDGSSSVLASRSTLRGGSGGHAPEFCEWSSTPGGDGGHGVWLQDSSALVLAGTPLDHIAGGAGGYGSCNASCAPDGFPGLGLVAGHTSFVRHSGVTISSISQAAGATVETPPIADPFLTHTGTHQAGRQLTFFVHGPAGAEALLHLGRSAVVLPQPGSPVEQLTSRERTFLLGPIPPSGQLAFSFVIPHGMPIGFSFFAQAEVVVGPRDQRLTNSIPLLMRHAP